MPHNLFHIVFMVSLFSVAIQGTLLPRVAEKLDMIDENEDVRKTFNDYQEDASITLIRMYIPKGAQLGKQTRQGSILPDRIPCTDD